MRESSFPVSRHLPVAVTVAVAVRACPIRRAAISDELSEGHGHLYGSAIRGHALGRVPESRSRKRARARARARKGEQREGQR